MLQDEGFEIVPRVLDKDQLARLRNSLAARSGAGQRGLLPHPVVHEIARLPAIIGLMSRHLNGPAKPVRTILFDKTQDTNWLVPWHQDLTIAVQERHDTDGYGPWSIKDGIHHVQPPAGVLGQMLTIRLHLDDCGETNGALKVIPGSHRGGKLDVRSIKSWRERSPENICRARAGDALLMRPLLLHASSRSTSDHQRRVLHIEYAASELPAPLRWSDAA